MYDVHIYIYISYIIYIYINISRYKNYQSSCVSALKTLNIDSLQQVKQAPAKSIANLTHARYISCFHFAQNLAQISFF